MKRMLGVLVLVFVSLPAGAQDLGDLGGFLGGDAASILNIPAPRGDAPAPAGNRGAVPPRGGPATAAPVDRLLRLRDVLAAANLALTPPQEAALNAVLDAEVPVMRRTLQARVLELQRARATAVPAGAPAVPVTPSPEELLPDLNRLNDQLVAKLAAAPALAPEQQALIKKIQKDQIRARGGFDALNLTMEDAGAPFSPEQSAQIQALFVEQAVQRAQLVRQSVGQPPDPARLTQLERETLAKVLRLLSPAQRAALSTAPARPPQ